MPVWGFILGCVVVCAVFALLGLWIHDHILIWGTSIGGAYIMIRGIGTGIGNYPDEFRMATDIKYGKFKTIPSWFWVYLSCVFLFSILGLIVQYHRHCQNKKKREQENDWEDIDHDKADHYKIVVE